MLHEEIKYLKVALQNCDLRTTNIIFKNNWLVFLIETLYQHFYMGQKIGL